MTEPGWGGRSPLTCPSAPAAERADVLVDGEELFVDPDALVLLPALGEQLPQPPAPGYVEAKRLREVFLRMAGRVGRHVIHRIDRHPAALEIDPGVVQAAVGLVDLPEGAPESGGARPAPIVVQEAVSQLMGDEPDQQGPGDLVAPSLPYHVALLDLHD